MSLGLSTGRPRQSQRASLDQYVHVDSETGRVCYQCFIHAVGLRGDLLDETTLEELSAHGFPDPFVPGLWVPKEAVD